MNNSCTVTTLKSNNKPHFAILIIIAAVSLITAVALSVHHFNYRAKILEQTKEDLWAMTVASVQEIEATLNESRELTDHFAGELTTAQPSEEQLLLRLRQLANRSPHFYGAGVSFRPYGHTKDRRLYAPYYKKGKQNKELELVMVEDVYDYTEPDHDWYSLAMAKGRSWTNPYWGAAGQSFMLSYSCAFYKNPTASHSDEPLGVVTIDFSMEAIKNLLNSLDLGPGGFSTIVSPGGNYVYHPNKEYVLSQYNLFTIAEEKSDADLLVLAQKAAKKESAIVENTDEVTGRDAWLAIAPIPTTGWSLQNTFLKESVPLHGKIQRRQIIHITLAFFIFLSACIALAFKIPGANSHTIPKIPLIHAALTILTIGLIWTITLSFQSGEAVKGTRLFNDTSLYKFMNSRSILAEQLHKKAPIFVPTSIFIESMAPLSGDEVRLTGYIRQKYDSSLPAGADKKFRIAKANNVTIKQVKQKTHNQSEIITYQFKAEVPKQFHHQKYPLETEQIQIRIAADESDPNVVLTPDLDAHPFRNSNLLPGIGRDVFFSGWNLIDSFYELHRNDTSTTFGQVNNTSKIPGTELRFNIHVRRNILNALITHLTPLAFVAIILYFLTILSSRLDPEKIFSICMAVFFVIVFSHIDIRRKIGGAGIFYLEYFYFVTYSAILYVTFNTVASVLDLKIPILRHNHRVISASLYWPVTTVLILTVTTFYFY